MWSFNYHWHVPCIHKGAWMMLPLHIYKCSFSEKRVRHKVLLSHYFTPKCLKPGTDAVPYSKLGYARKISISNQKNLRESAHTQSIYYYMCNPVRKAYIMCWCSHHCSIFSHKPPKDGKSTPRFFSYFYQGTHYQLLSENNTGGVKLWASPMCLTINCYPHKQKYLAIGTIWPVFFQKMYPTQLLPPLMRSALIWQGSFKRVVLLLHTPIRQAIGSYKA